jgi:hypothetical protein
LQFSWRGFFTEISRTANEKFDKAGFNARIIAARFDLVLAAGSAC